MPALSDQSADQPADVPGEVRRLLVRVDDLVKAASNRPDPAAVHAQASGLLEQAEALAMRLPQGEERDHWLVEVGRREDDVNRLVRLGEDATRLDLSQPLIPDGLPQPDPVTLDRAGDGSDTPRTPPNQRVVTSWPVLHVGRAPDVDLDRWRLLVSGRVERPTRWSWEEFRALPATTSTSDFHCVTGWSRFDNTWEGVRLRDVAEAVGLRHEVTHAVVNGAGAYTANLDVETLLRDDVLLAWSHDGAPLTKEHGGPLRLVVPTRYAWKSVKWVQSIQFLDRDVAGYWEMRGYHNVADPWLEQRYA